MTGLSGGELSGPLVMVSVGTNKERGDSMAVHLLSLDEVT